MHSKTKRRRDGKKSIVIWTNKREEVVDSHDQPSLEETQHINLRIIIIWMAE